MLLWIAGARGYFYWVYVPLNFEMKILTVKFVLNGVQQEDMLFFEANNLRLNGNQRQFVLDYGGKKVRENCYIFEDNYYIVSMLLPVKICNNPSIESILPIIRDTEEGIGREDLLPFAIDPGGNPFYISIVASDYGNVYIDTLNSRGFAEPILKIANSFEEFINGLQPEDFTTR